MVTLRSQTPRVFIASGIVLALLLFATAFLGLPHFHYGYWNAEPIALGMYGIATLIALWLAAGVAFKWLDISYPRGNLLLNCWLAWLAWQCISTAFSQSPWRSWFGPPEQVEGLAWYLCASLYMLLLAALWPIARFRTSILATSFLTMVALAAMHLVSDEQNNMLAGFFFAHIPDRYFANWLPFVWPDYLGYMAAWWWAALMLTYPTLRLRWLMPLGASMLMVLMASSNHGAFALISYAVLITIAIRIIQTMGLPHFRETSLLWRKFAMLAMVLPVMWMVSAPYIPTDYSAKNSQSIPTRILLNHISLDALAREPGRLLIGKGWGQFADDFFKDSLVRDVRIYDDARHQPNWPLVRGYNYHSHDMASQTLLSLGIIGFLLWLLMPVIAVRQLPSGIFWQVSPVLVAVTVLSHLWFAMPQTMPFQALCWFLLIFPSPVGGGSGWGHSRETEQACPPPSLPPIGGGIFLLAAGALAWSSVAQVDAIRYGMRLSDPFGQRYGIPLTADIIEEDIKRGGDRMRSFFINYTKRLTLNEANVQPKHLELYAAYLESMEKLTNDPRTGAYNGSSVLYGYNVLLTTFRNPAFKELRQHASRNYASIAIIHTQRAPYREDIIAPFLQALYESPHDTGHQRLMEVVQDLLALQPTHRSALWLGGKVLSDQPGFEQQGIEMMRAALKLGADRVYLISRQEIEALHSR